MEHATYFIIGPRAGDLMGRRVPETAATFESLHEFDLWLREQTGRDVAATIEVDVRTALREIGRPMPDLRGEVLVIIEALCRREKVPKSITAIIPGSIGRRTFYSRWAATMPEAPKAFVDRVRLLVARRLLEQESVPRKAAAYRAGYASGWHMQKAILKRAERNAGIELSEELLHSLK